MGRVLYRHVQRVLDAHASQGAAVSTTEGETMKRVIFRAIRPDMGMYILPTIRWRCWYKGIRTFDVFWLKRGFTIEWGSPKFSTH